MNSIDIARIFEEHFMAIVTWFFTFVALSGAYFNATMRCKLSYTIWLLSNGFFVWHNFSIGEYPQCTMFSFYFVIAVIGFKNTFRQSGWLKRTNVR